MGRVFCNRSLGYSWGLFFHKARLGVVINDTQGLWVNKQLDGGDFSLSPPPPPTPSLSFVFGWVGGGGGGANTSFKLRKNAGSLYNREGLDRD